MPLKTNDRVLAELFSVQIDLAADLMEPSRRLATLLKQGRILREAGLPLSAREVDARMIRFINAARARQ